MPRLDLRFRHATGAPANIATRINDLNLVFAPADLSFASTAVNEQDGLTSVDIGRCTEGEGPSIDVGTLFAAAGPGDPIVFLADGLISARPGATGCAAHPPHQQGVVVNRHARRWVLAHEVGHMLGLGHGASGLMGSEPSGLPNSPAPQLTSAEIAALTGIMPAAVLAEARTMALPERPVRPVRLRESRRRRAIPQERVDRLVTAALARIDRPRTPLVVDRLGHAIAARPALHREYRSLRRVVGAARLHRAIGVIVRQRTRMRSTGHIAKGTSIFRRVAVLAPVGSR